jgi:hypothetical protein
VEPRELAVQPMKKLRATKLGDSEAELVRLSHAEAISEIQALAVLGIKVIRGVELPDAVGVQVRHGMGRVVSFVTSPPMFAGTGGVIQDYGNSTPAGTPNDRTQTLSLVAIGFGGDIIVDIWVMAVN